MARKKEDLFKDICERMDEDLRCRTKERVPCNCEVSSKEDDSVKLKAVVSRDYVSCSKCGGVIHYREFNKEKEEE